MTVYQYRAADKGGKITEGEMNAPAETQLSERLRGDGLFLLSCKEREEKTVSYRLRPLELSEFCRDLGTMLGSGVPLLRSVSILIQRDPKVRIKRVYQQLYRSLQRGLPLSEAMEEQTGAFPELLIQMYRAGEASGRLDLTSQKMALHYQKEHRLNSKVRGAMVYPIILLCLTVVITLGIFLFVLPNFFTLFEGMKLPWPTQVVMAISGGLERYWVFWLVGALLAVLALGFVLRLPKVRLAVDRCKLRLPLVGKLLRTIYTARFARTLSSLYASGLPIITALQNARGTTGNRYIGDQFDGVVRQVRSGGALSDAIAQVDGFDPKLAATIRVGEETGKLDEMLESTAESFDYEAESATAKLTAILEPVLIILMALVIGFIMISVMLPIYSLYDQIGAGAGSYGG